MKTKLVYILPEYQSSIGSHFYHKYEFLRRLDREIDIFLILEKGERPEGIRHTYIQKFHFVPFRCVELFCVLSALRFMGYKTFWSHYSFCGGILAPLFGKSFYWNCGMPWLYRRSKTEEFFFRLVLRRSELVTGTSGLGRMYATKYGLNEKRVHILPNWISLDRYRAWHGRKDDARKTLSIPEGKKVVLFLHRLSQRKGAHFIVPVAQLFKNEPDVLFLVVGSGPLSDLISGENIRLVGGVPHKDTLIYFAAADVYFMPSEEEGFPHALLEAMAVGVPAVMTNVGSVPDIVPEGLKPFIVYGDTHAFHDAITNIVNDKKLQERLKKEEQEWVERFSSEKILEQFIALVSQTQHNSI